MPLGAQSALLFHPAQYLSCNPRLVKGPRCSGGAKGHALEPSESTDSGKRDCCAKLLSLRVWRQNFLNDQNTNVKTLNNDPLSIPQSY